MPIYVAYILGVILAIAGTVAALILITPEKKRAGLNKFFQCVHDLLNFKEFLLEKILKVIYIFLTFYCIASGFFMLFSSYSSYRFRSAALSGLLLMILGPIAVRLFYELLILSIRCLKSIIQINAKMPNNTMQNTSSIPEKMVYCPYCGAYYDQNKGNCPNGCTEHLEK